MAYQCLPEIHLFIITQNEDLNYGYIYNMYIQNLCVYMCACVYVRLGKFKGNMKGFLKEHKEQLKTSSDDICIKCE